MDEWSIHRPEYDSDLKRREALTLVTMWLDLENMMTMLSEKPDTKGHMAMGFIWWSSGSGSMLSMQGTWGPSSVRELGRIC